MMATTSTVRDFMNSRLVYLPEGTRPEVARNYILKFGITSVPVLNDAQQPVGSLSSGSERTRHWPEPTM
jgi:Mg/Co/Ni transporter MgtE